MGKWYEQIFFKRRNSNGQGIHEKDGNNNQLSGDYKAQNSEMPSPLFKMMIINRQKFKYTGEDVDKRELLCYASSIY